MDIITVINEAIISEDNVSLSDVYDVILHKAGEIDGQILNNKPFWKWVLNLLSKHGGFSLEEFREAYQYAFDSTSHNRGKTGGIPPVIERIRAKLARGEEIDPDELELFNTYKSMVVKARREKRH